MTTWLYPKRSDLITYQLDFCHTFPRNVSLHFWLFACCICSSDVSCCPLAMLQIVSSPLSFSVVSHKLLLGASCRQKYLFLRVLLSFFLGPSLLLHMLLLFFSSSLLFHPLFLLRASYEGWSLLDDIDALIFLAFLDNQLLFFMDMDQLTLAFSFLQQELAFFEF